MNEPKLDPHCEAILQEYRDNLPAFQEKAAAIHQTLKDTLAGAGLLVAALECRVKTEESLAGKLALKGGKYASLKDITDIIGLRIITFYTDDVDKVASAVERLFTVDWENSVDKRKLHEIDSFGYLSLHYVCSEPDFPFRFEIQMRTVLQHAWANMNHDTGYKSGVEVPREHLRNLNRLAGMLELVDEQFSRIRMDITNYRRKIQALVASGNLDEVPLDGDSYRSFLQLGPFDKLNRRIASVNQAEIQEVSLLAYMPVFKALSCKTLGDVVKLIKEHSEAAYQLACYQLGLTDLDIISSSLGPQNICIAAILKRGFGAEGLRLMFDQIGGTAGGNQALAEMILEQAQDLPFMNQK
jgi:ppGpp synthetase/RelA/SpoT-type nucleotidyltranferase